MFHESFPEIYADLFGALYGDPKLTWPETGLCAFAPLTGKSWKDGKKVVFYGRAQNGWVPSSNFKREDLASDVGRAKKALEICEAGHQTSLCKLDEDAMVPPCQDCGDPQLHWVHHRRRMRPYSVAQTAFWSVVGTVLRGLEPARASDPNWASRAAWSNLYKVAPAYDYAKKWGGNPSSGLISAQQKTCVGLLKEEMRIWQPRSAVFMTEVNRRSLDFNSVDSNGWFEPFRKSLQIDELYPLPKALRKGRVLVHTGMANAFAPAIRVIVALRPENLSREELSDQILAGIGEPATRASTG